MTSWQHNKRQDVIFFPLALSNVDECRAGESGRGGRERNPSVWLHLPPSKIVSCVLLKGFEEEEEEEENSFYI